MKKYTHDVDFFKNHSNDMFYILGFWYADGCIYTDKNSLRWSISQNEDDVYILENISSKIKYTGKIYTAKNNHIKTYKCKNTCSLSLTSRHFYEDMLKFGATERKSLVVQFPQIPEEYLSSFIRGFFDGDGHLRNENGVLRLQFTGGESFLESLNSIIQKKFNTKVKVQKVKNKDVRQLKYCGKKAKEILDWIYSEIKTHEELFLKRKYEIYKNYIPPLRTTFLLINKNGEEYKIDNLNKFCRERDLDESSMRHHLNKGTTYRGWKINSSNIGTTNKQIHLN